MVTATVISYFCAWCLCCCCCRSGQGIGRTGVSAFTPTSSLPSSAAAAAAASAPSTATVSSRLTHRSSPRRYSRQNAVDGVDETPGRKDGPVVGVVRAASRRTQLPLTETTAEVLAMACSLSYLSMEGKESRTPSFSAASSPMARSPYFDRSGLTPVAQVEDPTTESGATIFLWDGIGIGGADGYRSRNRRGSTIGKEDERGASAASSVLIVACRGSATPVNFSTNLKFELVPADRRRMTDLDVKGRDDGGTRQKQQQQQLLQPQPLLLHEGFQEASIGLWTVLRPELDRVMTTLLLPPQEDNNNDVPPDDVQLVFTGHSLGAATALLCAYQSTLTAAAERTEYDGGKNCRRTIPSPPPSVVTFGGPRLANPAMAEYMRKVMLFGGDVGGSRDSTTNAPRMLVCCCNLIHSYDPILQQNQPLWDALGFEAVGEELVCEPRQVTIYQTSQLRQDVLAWNLLDHCWYLGVFVGPRLPF